MSKTAFIPQVEAEQVKAEAHQDRYIAYAQCIHMMAAEAKEMANANDDEAEGKAVKTAEIGGRA